MHLLNSDLFPNLIIHDLIWNPFQKEQVEAARGLLEQVEAAGDLLEQVEAAQDLREQVQAAGDLDVTLSPDRKGLSAHNWF